jgi:iron complex outermembrane receptor protein
LKPNYKLTYAILAALSAPAGVSYAADTGGLEEVIVTAQRRSESIQDVPITIQAITGEQLSQLNVQTFDDVLRYLPNVTFSSNGPGQGNIYMRGLSAGFAGNQSSASINPFPNVASYLDDQSMTFPAHNLDIYMVDMERVEILEGPQGTLFGGGAEAGAVRYITNKPKLNVTEGYAELSYGTTAHGDRNSAVSGALNLPLINDTLAVRLAFYNDRRGGYIDNVPSQFTRKPTDLGPQAYFPYPANAPGADNYPLAQKAQNPVTYTGMRLSALYQVNDDWNVLVQQSYQDMEADGMFAQYPIGSNGQQLNPWEVTSFSPVWNKDRYSSTALTVNGKLGFLKAVYSGSYLTRHIDNTMDYTNYARSIGGFYYTCTGGPAGGSQIGAGTPTRCYSPVSSWHDTVESTHQSHEFRLSTPDEWQVRGLLGVFWEDFQIRDDMNFLYKSIPSCTPANLAIALAGGPVCVTDVTPVQAAIDPTQRNDSVAFGEDLRRGYKQTAFFGSVDYDIIPKVLTITGGTRYFRYTEDEVGSQYGTGGCVNKANNDPTCTGATGIGGSFDSAHNQTYTGFRSRANLTWHVTPDAMLYYTFSQGYRPGAFNRTTKGVTKIDVDPVTGLPTVGPDASPTLKKQFLKPLSYPPDELINNEIGFKSEFLEHHLQINGSIYQMDWKNVQTLIYNPPVYGNTTFGVQGPDYRVKGFELQVVTRVMEGLTLQGSMSYNDAKQTNSPCIRSAGVTAKTPGNPTPAGQCITQVWDAISKQNIPIPDPLGSVGSVPAFSPKMQFNLRVRYDWMVNEYKAFVMAGGNHVGSMDNEPSSFQSGEGVAIPSTTWLRYNQPGYTTYDASVGFGKDHWTVEAVGSNLSNSNASLYTTSAQFIRAEVPLRPRVLSLKIGMKF